MFSNLLATLIGLLSMLGLVPSSDVTTRGADASGVQRPESSLVNPAAAQAPLPTAGKIDFERYAGLWYELARLPVRFQDAASVSTAKYGVRGDGTVSVENTSYIGKETGYRIRGTAEPASEGRTDRLRVSFGGFLSLIPTPKEGNYWVMNVDRDYDMALVGTPDRNFLWLLARDGTKYDTEQAQAWLDRAAKLGFDTDELAVANWKTRTMRAD